MLTDMNQSELPIKTTATIELSFHAKEAVKLFNDCTPTILDEFNEFKKLLEHWTEKASKETHYYRLNYWENAVLKFIMAKLQDQNSQNYSFWLNLYKTANTIHLSPHLKTYVKRHHASAYDRNQAFLLEINSIVDNI
jgi:hypothetical protein